MNKTLFIAWSFIFCTFVIGCTRQTKNLYIPMGVTGMVLSEGTNQWVVTEEFFPEAYGRNVILHSTSEYYLPSIATIATNVHGTAWIIYNTRNPIGYKPNAALRPIGNPPVVISNNIVTIDGEISEFSY